MEWLKASSFKGCSSRNSDKKHLVSSWLLKLMLAFYIHRCTEEEKQVGFCHSRDNNSSTHHSHYYCNTASCGNRHNQCKRLQNNSDLCSWHHSEKGKAMTSAVKRLTLIHAKSTTCRSQRGRRYSPPGAKTKDCLKNGHTRRGGGGYA